MRHRKKTVILGREYGPRKALIRAVANALIIFEKIKTTKAKAKAIKPFVERCITIGKNPTLAHQRLLLKRLGRRGPVRKILEVLSPRYKTRNGGYTRIMLLGSRLGDAAEMVQIEFIDSPSVVTAKPKK